MTEKIQREKDDYNGRTQWRHWTCAVPANRETQRGKDMSNNRTLVHLHSLNRKKCLDIITQAFVMHKTDKASENIAAFVIQYIC